MLKSSSTDYGLYFPQTCTEISCFSITLVLEISRTFVSSWTKLVTSPRYATSEVSVASKNI